MGIRCPSESGIGTWRNECGRQTVHSATGSGGIDSCVLRTAIIPHPPSEISSCVCQGEPFPNNQLITSGLSLAVSWRLVSLTVRLFKFRVLSSSGDVLSNKLLTFQVDPQLADLLRTQMNKVATCSDVTSRLSAVRMLPSARQTNRSDQRCTCFTLRRHGPLRRSSHDLSDVRCLRIAVRCRRKQVPPIGSIPAASVSTNQVQRS